MRQNKNTKMFNFKMKYDGEKKEYLELEKVEPKNI